MPSWHGAQLKHRDNFILIFTLLYIRPGYCHISINGENFEHLGGDPTYARFRRTFTHCNE
jgi:hypothetical protein